MGRRQRKKYRAVVIDLRKIGRVIIFSLIFAFVFSGLSKLIKVMQPEKGNIEDAVKEKRAFDITEGLKDILTFFTGFDPDDYRTILKTEVPSMKVSEGSAIWSLAEGSAAEPVYNPEGADIKVTAASPEKNDGKEYKIKEIDSSQAKSLSGSDKKILLKNETSFSVDIASMLKAPMPFSLSFNGPEVLILHTHATESFAKEGDVTYNSSSGDRTQNTEENIVKVGEKMAEIFRENGIETLHDRTLHDYPSYNGSYASSLKTAENYLKKYPTIKMIIDVHRDAIVYSDGTKAKVLTEIDGKKAAQLMFVIGTNAGGLEHPEWKKNLTTAVKLQSAIEQIYPGLMRGINLRKERFNEHLTVGSMILEVGTSGNTLSEALYSARLAAKVIADTIK